MPTKLTAPWKVLTFDCTEPRPGYFQGFLYRGFLQQGGWGNSWACCVPKGLDLGVGGGKQKGWLLIDSSIFRMNNNPCQLAGWLDGWMDDGWMDGWMVDIMAYTGLYHKMQPEVRG